MDLRSWPNNFFSVNFGEECIYLERSISFEACLIRNFVQQPTSSGLLTAQALTHTNHLTTKEGLIFFFFLSPPP